MKKTKIVATIGPATESKEKVTQLRDAGVNSFRINMSHGDTEQWSGFIKTIREVCDDTPVFLDTRGPEIRLLGVEEAIELAHGDELRISISEHATLPYLSHPIKLEKEQRLLLDDGNIEAMVEDVKKDHVQLKITQPAVLTNRRKVSVPHTQDHLPILTDQDKKDIESCKGLDFDGYAVSFARSKKDIDEVRELIGEEKFIIAKIENQEGVDHIEEIIKASDAVMVARGDLGVEIPLEEVPLVQKQIIEMCNRAAKPVVVATQMLSSMRNHNRPTRAEASDVANAILDGADCVMLSDETAMGKYPVETVQTMARIAARIEERLANNTQLITTDIKIGEAITNAAYEISQSLQADAIVISTVSGFTARMIARHKPKTPLVAVAHDKHNKRKLRLSWGVEPILFEHSNHDGHKTIFCAVEAALHHELVKDTDLIVTTAGVDMLKEGSTNLIEVHRVSELIEYHKKHN